MMEFVYPHTRLVAGVDEVGRGPLVGAVVTAAVILDPARPIIGLNDSKKLSEKRRLALFSEIQEKALAWSLGRAEPHGNRRAEYFACHDAGDAACGSRSENFPGICPD